MLSKNKNNKVMKINIRKRNSGRIFPRVADENSVVLRDDKLAKLSIPAFLQSSPAPLAASSTRMDIVSVLWELRIHSVHSNRLLLSLAAGACG